MSAAVSLFPAAASDNKDAVDDADEQDDALQPILTITPLLRKSRYCRWLQPTT